MHRPTLTDIPDTIIARVWPELSARPADELRRCDCRRTAELPAIPETTTTRRSNV
jgi:hypothetical protein